MLRSCIVSAPGKVILNGEHAVVYGKNAIAASLGLRTIAHFTPATDENSIIIELPDISIKRKWSCDTIAAALHLPLGNPLNPSPPTFKQLAALVSLTGTQADTTDNKSLAILTFLFLYAAIIRTSDGHIPGIHLHLTSTLPSGAGLGSSAAYSVCLSAGLLTASSLIEPIEENNSHMFTNFDSSRNYHWDIDSMTLINKWAFEAERLIHGTPSGIDNSVSTFGGAISFISGSIKTLDQIPQLRILLVHTKVPRSTKKLVANVREKFNSLPSVFEPIMDAIGAISNESQTCLNLLAQDGSQDCPLEKSYGHLEMLIDINQQLLNVIGVNHTAIEDVCRITAKYGFHSKLTGAGGGGCVLTLLRNDTSATVLANLRADLEHAGYESWETVVGSYGVLYHTKDADTNTESSN